MSSRPSALLATNERKPALCRARCRQHCEVAMKNNTMLTRRDLLCPIGEIALGCGVLLAGIALWRYEPYPAPLPAELVTVSGPVASFGNKRVYRRRDGHLQRHIIGLRHLDGRGTIHAFDIPVREVAEGQLDGLVGRNVRLTAKGGEIWSMDIDGTTVVSLAASIEARRTPFLLLFQTAGAALALVASVQLALSVLTLRGRARDTARSS
jgi:hypothetical protein